MYYLMSLDLLRMCHKFSFHQGSTSTSRQLSGCVKQQNKVNTLRNKPVVFAVFECITVIYFCKSPAEWCTCSISAHTDYNEAECKCCFDVTAFLQTASLWNASLWMHYFPDVFYVHTVHWYNCNMYYYMQLYFHCVVCLNLPVTLTC